LDAEPIVEVIDIVTRFGDRTVHSGISLSVKRGEVFAVVGASGSGKSVMMREMAMLQKPTSGRIRLFGFDVSSICDRRRLYIRRHTGVLFQSGALFSDLTVAENVMVPLREHTRLGKPMLRELAMVKIALSGLEPEVGALYPNQLSGGMKKRVALARAIALDPDLLFLDEPGSGLDPIGTDALDALVLQLKNSLGLTIVMVTHDMDSLWSIADRVALIGDGRLLGLDTMANLSASKEPAVRGFFRKESFQ